MRFVVVRIVLMSRDSDLRDIFFGTLWRPSVDDCGG